MSSRDREHDGNAEWSPEDAEGSPAAEGENERDYVRFQNESNGRQYWADMQNTEAWVSWNPTDAVDIAEMR